jgi:hypothetical protein
VSHCINARFTQSADSGGTQTLNLAKLSQFLIGPVSAARLRVFECGFVLSFLFFMARNYGHPYEWLTEEGFHLVPGEQHPLEPVPVPPLHRLLVPLHFVLLFGSGLALLWGRYTRIARVMLLVLAIHALAVDMPSAFALNKFYILGFAVLATAPPIWPT